MCRSKQNHSQLKFRRPDCCLLLLHKRASSSPESLPRRSTRWRLAALSGPPLILSQHRRNQQLLPPQQLQHPLEAAPAGRHLPGVGDHVHLLLRVKSFSPAIANRRLRRSEKRERLLRLGPKRKPMRPSVPLAVVAEKRQERNLSQLSM